ncbi:hypothetical protein VNO80_21400 [Phaseolus coccineus]|uniref:Pentatricopeptide repeat-containing protein n=1 Tax=Phaseolus coccineus TaxID=3886 RepID=A0AAN9M310_PHACN
MKRVFDAMPARDRVSWNCLISGYAGRGFLIQSIHGHVVSSLMFLLGVLWWICTPKQGIYFVQDRVLMKFPRRIWLCNTLSAGLMRCGRIEDWRQLFYEMRGKDSISLTAMIAGFTQNGIDIEAIDLFKDEITKF